MDLAYYPGCTLHTSSRLYDIQTKVVLEKLDIRLLELEDWNCCGATSAGKTDDFMAVALPARNLGIADAMETGELVIPCSACYSRMLVARELLESVDAILSLACGAGAQFLGEKFPHKTVLPGLNTTFVGVVDAPGFFSERCQICGDCILHLTGGICPITQCSKSLMNGPCGGTNHGQCEINPDIPCAWYRIHERLKAQGKTALMDAFIPPKDWSTSRDGGPRKQIREDLAT